MKGEVTAIIEKAPEGGYWAICPEVPGANGQWRGTMFNSSITQRILNY